MSSKERPGSVPLLCRPLVSPVRKSPGLAGRPFASTGKVRGAHTDAQGPPARAPVLYPAPRTRPPALRPRQVGMCVTPARPWHVGTGVTSLHPRHVVMRITPLCPEHVGRRVAPRPPSRGQIRHAPAPSARGRARRSFVPHIEDNTVGSGAAWPGGSEGSRKQGTGRDLLEATSALGSWAVACSLVGQLLELLEAPRCRRHFHGHLCPFSAEEEGALDNDKGPGHWAPRAPCAGAARGPPMCSVKSGPVLRRGCWAEGEQRPGSRHPHRQACGGGLGARSVALARFWALGPWPGLSCPAGC